ncbi:NfeD family protein [Desulfoscipio geothermicus]|uniref:NfeD-like C-terminal, partner-binding n=1 Tax=Desulfoscipio geothermicus DSM 3669 TaxID=1121426 RepID=A0A1I6E9X8_9FIRM|nr:NfeD family protein [Desulfoscipio geothermicus]SFR14352.1 NfeD-like C-terminal, partner-binding [Desulfoscipio geothermicus DSM 3669]
MLLKVFQLCFWVGALFTAASFILGQLLDFGELGGDVDSGSGESMISPFKPVVIAAFITVFGGVGIIGLQHLKLGVFGTLAAAVFCGWLVSFILFRFLIVPLYKVQNTAAVSQKDLVGMPAQVQLDIKGSSFGRITYVVNDNTYSAPARSVDGDEIPRGVRVVIVDINRNVFLVTKI